MNVYVGGHVHVHTMPTIKMHMLKKIHSLFYQNMLIVVHGLFKLPAVDQSI